jgi:creatinine amidohydrolase
MSFIAHGHGPSTNYIDSHAQEFKNRYDLTVICLMCDHAGANETSIMMYLRPELVEMSNLPQDTAIWPLGMLGEDPGIHASRGSGKSIVDFEIKKMSSIIRKELKKEL